MEQIALTHQEKAVAAFLTLSFALGLAIKWARFSIPTPSVEVVEPQQNQPQPSQAVRKPEAVFPIDINSADSIQLVKIPGVGPVLAHRILQHRRRYGRFRSLNDLTRVKGIGVKRLEKLKPYIRIGDGARNTRKG